MATSDSTQIPQITFKSVLPQAIACFSAASIHLIVGFILAYSAVMIPQLEKEDSDISVTIDQTTYIASSALLAAPIFAPFNGYVVDSCGRLSTIKMAVIPNTIGWICIATAHSVRAICVGRILTGLTLAMGPGAAIVYAAEISRPDLRGTLTCLGPVMISIGSLVIYVKGRFLQWRTIAWLNVGYGFLPLILLSLWAPESPLYLVSKGKNEKAMKALVYLSRMGDHSGKPEEQFANILNEQMLKQKSNSSTKNLLKGIKKPTIYKPFIVLILLFFCQQYSGIYVIIFYSVTFLQDFSSALDPSTTTILVGMVRVAMGLPTIYLLKKCGRRPLCMCSGFGMAIMMSISGSFERIIKPGEETKPWMLWIPVVAILICIGFSVFGLLTIPWTMTAELFPLELRGLCQGLVISIAFCLMFSMLFLYRYLTVLFGATYALHWFFATFASVSVLLIWLFLPETHMKKLSEIEDYFANNSMIYPLYKVKQ